MHFSGMCESDQKVSVNATVSLIKREIDVICNDTSPSTSVRPPTEGPPTTVTTIERITQSASTQSVTTAATSTQSTSGPTVHTTGSFYLEPQICFALD